MRLILLSMILAFSSISYAGEKKKDHKKDCNHAEKCHDKIRDLSSAEHPREMRKKHHHKADRGFPNDAEYVHKYMIPNNSKF